MEPLYSKEFWFPPFLPSDDDPLHIFAEKHLSVLPASDWEVLAHYELPDTQRAELQALWWEHATDEYRALSQFSYLLADMLQVGAPLSWLGCASRLIRDETRHVALCVKAAAALGMDPSAQHFSAVRPNTDVTPMARIVRHMLTTVYCSETVALELIGWARERETIPPLKSVMTAILADESFHSRFGFLWLRDHWNHLDTVSRTTALDALPVALWRLSNGLPPILRPVADSAITGIILPALDSLGIDAQRAWEQRSETR